MLAAEGLREVGGERASLAAAAAEGESQQQRQQQHSERVVPVEQLEAPVLAGELAGVRPRAPAEHGEDAKHDRQRIAMHDVHGSGPDWVC